MPAAEDVYEQRERRFRSLYQEHYRLVQAYAARRMDAQADVADVVAEVFTIAWRRLAEVPAPPGELVWLYGVARRVIAGKYRSARRFRNLLGRIQSSHGTDGADLQYGAAQDPLRDRVLEAMERLPPAEREALRLVLWEQLSHAEAAQVLDCSANAVAIRMHRAKGRLREALTTGPAATESADPIPAVLKVQRS